MLSQKEFNVLYEFLDRVDLKGHNERVAMGVVIDKLSNMTIPDNSEASSKNSNKDT